MTHDQSFETHAPERYLLGEMSELEKFHFEEHYFTCEECAESVRLGAARSLYGAGSQIAGECRVRRAVAGAGSVFAGRPEGAT